jgi:heat shock protein HslJ
MEGALVPTVIEPLVSRIERRVRPARRRGRRAGFAIVVPFFALVVLLPACGGDDDGGSTAQDPADLEGKAWVLTQMLDAEGNTVIVDIGVDAEFDGSAVSGTSGCNRYNASYEASGNEISFGEIAGTLMACPEDETAVEDRYRELLSQVATFEIEGRSMSMSDGEGTPVLQFSQG